MSRTRGHMRRKKSRLTGQTLSAVMELGQRDDAAVESDDLVELDILELLKSPPDVVTVPAAYNDAGSIYTGASAFPAQQFVFGLTVCPECHNELVYYQDRDVLAAGYLFRCRVCQHEVRASLP